MKIETQAIHAGASMMTQQHEPLLFPSTKLPRTAFEILSMAQIYSTWPNLVIFTPAL